jgi:pyruvate dehydrogenase complex dehydrogenase (E1) component
MTGHPAALQLRLLQTVVEVAAENFEVDAPSIVLRTLEQLIDRHELDSSVRDKASETYQLDAADGPTAGTGDSPAR